MRESKKPSSITKLWKYFDRLYPNDKGGNCNPAIKFTFDVHEDALKYEVEYEHTKHGIYLWKKSI